MALIVTLYHERPRSRFDPNQGQGPREPVDLMRLRKAGRETVVEAIRILRREHGNTAKLLDVLERQYELFRARETPDYDIVQAAVDYFLTFPQEVHHPKENLVFRKLKARNAAAAIALGDLEEEHKQLAGLTQHFAEAVESLLGDAEMPRDVFEHAVGDFIEHQRQHMSMEEQRFFPAALEALSEEDWVEIDGQLVDQDDPLFGAEVNKRFKDLRERIMRWEREDRSPSSA